jgi:DNA-binding NtrC family response regulator
MSTTPEVLLVDDDPAVGKVLGALLRQEQIESREVHSAPLALAALELEPFDVVVTDLRMPEMDGLQLLAKIFERWPEQAVIMLTAHGTVSAAVEAMKLGARDFLVKPFNGDEVVTVVRRALAVAKRSTARVPALGLESGGLLGSSDPMREVLSLVERAARSSSTVMIRGESGTGKELVARAIHELSARRSGPFIKVNCTEFPEALFESEIFGYEKGAFTGAATRKPGRVELADGGTLFLDEIGDVPLSAQVKLLRVLQERELQRLGGTHSIKVDVRFVAATHRDLELMVEKEEFREDLFYRLNVVPVRLPALRERVGDIELLARHFCALFATANDRPGTKLSAAAIEPLVVHPWPGNVRQLQNFVERLIVMSDGPTIDRADVERELQRDMRANAPVSSRAPSSSGSPGRSELAAIEERRWEAEREAYVAALKHAGNNRTSAARLLGVSRRTFYNRLKEYRIAPPDSSES